MLKSNETQKIIKALLLALIIFIVMFLLLKLPFILAGVTSILVFIGLVLFIPTKYYDKDGNEITYDIIEDEMNRTLFKIHESGEEDLEIISSISIFDEDVNRARNRLYQTAKSIYKEINHDIKMISDHQFFLEYYIPKGKEIVSLYKDSQNAKGKQFDRLKSNVIESLNLLQEVYDDELKSFYSDSMKTMSYEKELLEQNVKKIRERNRITEKSIDSNIDSLEEEKELLKKIKKEGEEI